MVYTESKLCIFFPQGPNVLKNKSEFCKGQQKSFFFKHLTS